MVANKVKCTKVEQRTLQLQAEKDLRFTVTFQNSHGLFVFVKVWIALKTKAFKIKILSTPLQATRPTVAPLAII